MDILGPFRPIEQEFMKVLLQSSSHFLGNKQFTSEFGRKFLEAAMFGVSRKWLAKMGALASGYGHGSRYRSDRSQLNIPEVPTNGQCVSWPWPTQKSKLNLKSEHEAGS